MDTLRGLFTDIGFSAVETFIASGNVIFEAPEPNGAELEHRIESALRDTLGYEVATFFRTNVALAEIALYKSFSPDERLTAQALNIAFLKAPIDETAQQKLAALTSPIDLFHAYDRELFWLCRKKQSESTFSNAVLEKTIRQQSTLRTIKTVHSLAQKYAGVMQADSLTNNA